MFRMDLIRQLNMAFVELNARNITSVVVTHTQQAMAS